MPQGPLYTAAEAKAQAHGRAERGTTCHYWGRCRLPNAYLYDKEIIPRVATFIQRDDRFRDTSVWVLGQRRWVYLKGCVATQAQSDQLEARGPPHRRRRGGDQRAHGRHVRARRRYDVERNAR